MLEKQITYTDYNGEERTETFYFNLSKAEITEMNLEVEGGLSTYLQQIVETKETPKLIKIFKSIILRSVGKKSPDGKRFIKEGVATEFSETEAYSVLFMELATDADAAVKFLKAIIPADLAEQADSQLKEIDTKGKKAN